MLFNSIQKFNVINDELLNLLIKDYNSRNSYDTNLMNKADTGNVVSLILKNLEDAVERKLQFVTGNFYKHSVPYLPHTDFKSYEQNYLNIVIPLTYTGQLASLIVFDQMWEQDSVTWCMHYPVQYFTYNIGVKGCPYEYPIMGSTNTAIDNELYKLLTHYPVDCLFGLSGNAYKFEPGSIIAFDNRFIHCTSNMQGTKLGLSLRFKK